MPDAELRQQADAGSAEHQWRLSQVYRQQKRPARASRYFRRALQQGYHEAVSYQLELWTRTPGEFASFKRAQDLLNKHIDSPLLQSWCWRLGVISGSQPLEAEVGLLEQQLALGNPEALRYAALRCTLAGKEGAARWFLQQAASGKDQLAVEVLAEEASHCLPDLAPETVQPPAAGLLAEVLQTAPAADLQEINDSPRVLRYSRWLSPLACRLVAMAAAPHLQPSLTYEPSTGRQIESPLRTSHSMTFMPWLVDPSVAYIQRLLAGLSGREMNQCEVLGLLRYFPGQAYQLHYDAFAENGGNRQMFEDGGQRTRTALVYLNDSYTGGETRFEHLDVEIKGHTGDLLIFDNVDSEGLRDRLSLHAGKPVVSGIKWLLSQWYRESDNLYTRQMGWARAEGGL